MQEIEEAWHADMQSMFMNRAAGAGEMAMIRGSCFLDEINNVNVYLWLCTDVKLILLFINHNFPPINLLVDFS